MSSQAEAAAAARPSDAAIQDTLARAVRLYAERAAEHDAPLAPFPPGVEVTATEVVVTVSAMLKAANLQLFELGMWQAWAGRA